MSTPLPPPLQVHQVRGGRRESAGLDRVGRGQLLHSGRFPRAGRRLQDAGEAALGFSPERAARGRQRQR